MNIHNTALRISVDDPVDTVDSALAKVHLYPNNLKNGEFDKEAPQEFCLERVTIAQRQGTSENRVPAEKPTPSKTNSSGCLGINTNRSGNALFVDTICSALPQEPSVPINICPIIWSYYKDGGAEIEHFIRTECLQTTGRQTRVLPCVFGKAEAFLKQQNINRHSITSLDLSGIAWDVEVHYRSLGTESIRNMQHRAESDQLYAEAWTRLQTMRYRQPTNILLELIQQLAPNVKTIKMTNWVYSIPAIHGDRYSSCWEIADNVVTSLSKFPELETLELSNEDFKNYITNYLAYSLTREVPAGEQVPFPKLKTICIRDGTRLAEMPVIRPQLAIATCLETASS